MATTYNLISSQVVTGTPTSVSFTSIPSTYTDLALRISIKDTDTSANNDNAVFITYNGDTATNYSDTQLYGYNAAAGSARRSNQTKNWGTYTNTTLTSTANTFSSFELYIPNYTSSANKAISFFGVGEWNTTSVRIMNGAWLWRGTSAITSITLDSQYSTAFATGSSFYLYGIKNS